MKARQKYYKPRQRGKIISQLARLAPSSKLIMVALEPSQIDSHHLEAARQNIRRKLRRKGRLSILVHPDIGLSKKPASARMGKGKGKITKWLANIAAGHPIFQLDSVGPKEGLPALKSAANKLPIRVKILQE